MRENVITWEIFLQELDIADFQLTKKIWKNMCQKNMAKDIVFVAQFLIRTV